MSHLLAKVRVVLTGIVVLALLGILYSNTQRRQVDIISPVFYWHRKSVRLVGNHSHDDMTADKLAMTTRWWLPTTSPILSGSRTSSTYHTTVINLNVSSLSSKPGSDIRLLPGKHLHFGMPKYLETEKLTNLDKNLLIGNPTINLFPCPGSIGNAYMCQRYHPPDWQSGADMGFVLSERMHRIRERCRKYHSYMFNASLSEYGHKHNKKIRKRKGGARVMINSRLQLGFCWMPKMGSSFWKRAWYAMNFAPSNTSVIPLRSQVRQDLLADYFSQQTNKKKSYTSYTISRSPWDRLVSVYREKCETYWRWRRTHQCKLKFGVGCEITSFESFLSCVVTSFSQEQTEGYGHVDKTYKRCGVCDFPYDYVVTMENMAVEKEYIFKQAGVIDPLRTMDKVRQRTIRTVEKSGKKLSYTDYWKLVPSDLIDRVRFYYRYEIFLFDYPETPFTI